MVYKIFCILTLGVCALFGGGQLEAAKLTPLTGIHIQKLVHAAKAAREKAYAPYSDYRVGAAIMTSSYEIIEGCNIENASYGLTICAERCAVFSALAQNKNDFAAIAVVTKDGGAPCGACRQVLNEFNPDMLVIIANERGEIIEQAVLSSLLPHAFGPQNLA